MLTPTISLPDFFISSGTVAAISSTFWAVTATVEVVGEARPRAGLTVLRAARHHQCPAIANVPAARHQRGRLSDPVNMVALSAGHRRLLTLPNVQSPVQNYS